MKKNFLAEAIERNNAGQDMLTWVNSLSDEDREELFEQVQKAVQKITDFYSQLPQSIIEAIKKEK